MSGYSGTRWTISLALACISVGCHSATSPSGAGTSQALKVFSSSSPAGPWSSQSVSVMGQDAVSLVDPSPILMPDGTILVYYLMNYEPFGQGDPASGQPNNQWKIGVAQSTDNGDSFVHKGVAYTGITSTTDPFPLMLDTSGTIRLFFFNPAARGITSVTATDSTGLHFASALDPARMNNSGTPGALKIGGIFYFYVPSGYLTSSDGLFFSGGGPTVGLNGSDLSPIDAGGGTYLMSMGCAQLTICMESSTDAIQWTQTSTVGSGSVGGLVKAANGVLRIYAPSQ
jgi:hypothetical protein